MEAFHLNLLRKLGISRSQQAIPSAIDTDVLDLVTIAFNNVKLIEFQHRLLQLYLLDRHVYTVGDNSNDMRVSVQIRRYCTKQGVEYVRLPHIRAHNPSRSHGIALNWMWRNYLRGRRHHAFGFLDHDVFPLRPTRLLPYLANRPCYGLPQERGTQWYLWPGFCIFLYSHCAALPLDFLPAPGLDTGGGNWQVLYRDLPHTVRPQVTERCQVVRPGLDPNTNPDRQLDLVAYLGDDWVHLINGSNWKVGCGTPKSVLLEQFLAALLADRGET